MIGRQGRLARALRTVVRASAARSRRRVVLEIVGVTTSSSRVGRVGRPHGVDGSFFVDGASDADERFAAGATLLVDGAPAEASSRSAAPAAAA